MPETRCAPANAYGGTAGSELCVTHEVSGEASRILKCEIRCPDGMECKDVCASSGYQPTADPGGMWAPMVALLLAAAAFVWWRWRKSR